MVLHIVGLFIFENLFDEPVKVFVVVLYQAFNVFMLTDHRFNGLSEFFIFKHQRQNTQANNFRRLNHLFVHWVHRHKETNKEEFGVKAILNERLKLRLYKCLGWPEAAWCQLIVNIVKIFLLQKLQECLCPNYVLCKTVVIRVLFHQEFSKCLPCVIEQVDLVE